jgi:hypothetical protein
VNLGPTLQLWARRLNFLPRTWNSLSAWLKAVDTGPFVFGGLLVALCLLLFGVIEWERQQKDPATGDDVALVAGRGDCYKTKLQKLAAGRPDTVLLNEDLSTAISNCEATAKAIKVKQAQLDALK